MPDNLSLIPGDPSHKLSSEPSPAGCGYAFTHTHSCTKLGGKEFLDFLGTWEKTVASSPHSHCTLSGGILAVTGKSAAPATLGGEGGELQSLLHPQVKLTPKKHQL